MNWRNVTKAVLLLAALLLFFGVVWDIDLASFERRLKATGFWAPILFSLLMIAGILFSPIPTSPLTLMSPKLFGLWGGLTVTLISATVGAAIAFLIARKLGERFFVRFPQYRRVQHLLPRDATAFAIFLLRLPPSPTFDLVSYLAGLTGIPIWQFMLATFLGMIPVTATLCFLGSVAPAVWLVPALAALVLFWVVRLARKRRINE
ncbi:MAG: TVP38/TMEM64 family protein [Verrucomicrobia bacterium]|nr:TVP38/TMEM64 family protein [Verrucomicrobiota bacterium]